MKFITLRDLYFLSVIALIQTVSWFASPTLTEIVVRSIAFTAYRFSRTKRQRIEKNLSAVFDGKLSKSQTQSIVQGSFYEFWYDLFSLLPFRTKRSALSIDLHGLEHLLGALKNGKGVILWESSSFGRRVLAKQILHENGFAICQVHGENHIGGFQTNSSPTSWIRRHVIRRFFEKHEKQFVTEIIYLPTSDSLAFTRVLLERLKHNAIICIAGDGRLGHKFIPIKFLGRTDLFSTGMMSLTRISGASLVPLFCFQEREQRTRVVIESPIRLEANIDRGRGLENGARQYGNLLESYIRRYPDQYRSWHMLNETQTSLPV